MGSLDDSCQVRGPVHRISSTWCVMEWRLPSLSGYSSINRGRNTGPTQENIGSSIKHKLLALRQPTYTAGERYEETIVHPLRAATGRVELEFDDVVIRTGYSRVPRSQRTRWEAQFRGARMNMPCTCSRVSNYTVSRCREVELRVWPVR